jgi:hypothetical protein
MRPLGAGTLFFHLVPLLLAAMTAFLNDSPVLHLPGREFNQFFRRKT